VSQGGVLVTGDDPLPRTAGAVSSPSAISMASTAATRPCWTWRARSPANAGTPFGLVTFEPHPRTFFRPEDPVFRLSPLPLKARLAAALGASFVAALTFDRGFAALEPEDFVRDVLAGRLAAAHVVTGYDFHFGRGRKGNAATLKSLGKSAGLRGVEHRAGDGRGRRGACRFERHPRRSAPWQRGGGRSSARLLVDGAGRRRGGRRARP
jgi:hypothetical protein